MASSLLPTPPAKPATNGTTVLINNLHCPSCLSIIENSLSSLVPRPINISSSIVNHSVVVEHPVTLPVTEVVQALAQAGFEIWDVVSTALDQDGYARDAVLLQSSNEELRHKHEEYCEVCRRSVTPSQQDLQGVVVESQKPTTFRAKLAVSGMTCSSCSNAIRSSLKERNWIKNTTISLLSNSAVVDFTSPGSIEQVMEAIEDLGYDAQVESLEDLSQTRQKVGSANRSVHILVSGINCAECPKRILAGLSGFGSRLTVLEPLTTEKPILEIAYIPDAPEFTIRNILSSISEIDQRFKASVYHPPTLEEKYRQLHRQNLKRVTIRLVLTTIIAVPTFVLGIVFMTLVPPSNPILRSLLRPFSSYTGAASKLEVSLFMLATPVYFFAADIFHRRAFKEIWVMWKPSSKTPLITRLTKFGSMDLLISLGTSIAFFSSLGMLVLEAIRPPSEDIEMGVSYFDAVVFLTLFQLIGRLLEMYSKSKAGDAVSMLGKLRPTEAVLVERKTPVNGTADTTSSTNGHAAIKTISVDLLEVGDEVRVLNGTSPPCDGIVTEGETQFDESSLTGESRLVHKATGEEVFTGTFNKSRPITVRATRISGSSMLDQIVTAVRDGQTKRAPIERFADAITGYFVPATTFLAIITWIIWLSLGLSGSLPSDYLDTPLGGWPFWSLQFAIAVFVVACPCGIGLAAPTALFVGGGLAAEHGILVKGGGEAFQEASKLDCIVFDKTGTLTEGGEPQITDHELYLDPENGIDEALILSSVYTLEESSRHPIAQAIVSFCTEKSARTASTLHIDEIPGKGMRGVVSPAESDHLEVLLGNEALLVDFHVPILGSVTSTLTRWQSQGKSIALFAARPSKNGSFGHWSIRAVFAVSDPVRADASHVVSELQNQGIDVWMLSGDNRTTACAVGATLGIPKNNIIAGALPGEKASKIQHLQQSLYKKPREPLSSRLQSKIFGRTRTGQIRLDERPTRAIIAMVGDGINDSPALAVADVSIAIGSGSDVAISSASFVLLSPNLGTILTLIRLSRAVFRRVKFNFFWAMAYNIVAVPFAGGALYWLKSSSGSHVRLDPVWASLAMAMSSVSVVLSSLTLRTRLPWIGFRAGKNTLDSES